MTRNTIGVDLSKNILDICDPRRGESRVPNKSAAIARWLVGLEGCDMIVYEATSGSSPTTSAFAARRRL